MEKGNKKVLVGLSGGVDSSLAAFLLKKEGFSPVGIFLSFLKEGGRCCDINAQRRAREVCRKLEIPFYTLDVQKEFQKNVVEYFKKELKEGRTPNPCVVCNKEIKFKTLIEKMIALNADYVATGHYIQLCKGDEKGEYKLLIAKDTNKDQSYFLWRLKKSWLEKIIFPLGGLKKEDVRKMAKKEDFPSANVKESQDACFLEEGLTAFLNSSFKDSPGDIISKEEGKIGEHKGLFYYTIGQRKGLDLSGGPYYVLKKDVKKNELLVTKDEKKLEKKEFFYEDSNFLQKVTFPFECEIKIRYAGKRLKAVVEKEKVLLENPAKAVTPGQSVVFYKDDILVGGGVIKF
jgi:tRNA-uridine 2-sulfurtransferase